MFNLIRLGQGVTSGFGVTSQPACGITVLPLLCVPGAPVAGPRLVSDQKPPLGAVPEPSEGHPPEEAAADPENCSTL